MDSEKYVIIEYPRWKDSMQVEAIVFRSLDEAKEWAMVGAKFACVRTVHRLGPALLNTKDEFRRLRKEKE